MRSRGLRPSAPPTDWADAGMPAPRSWATICPYVRVGLIPPGRGAGAVPGIGRGQNNRRACRGLVDAVGVTEEALLGRPQANERTTPRG